MCTGNMKSTLPTPCFFKKAYYKDIIKKVLTNVKKLDGHIFALKASLLY